MKDIVILTQESMASSVSTRKILYEHHNRICLIVVVNQIPGSIFKQIKSTNKLLKKSSLWFAYYKFVESTLYNILIRIHKFGKSNRYKKRVTLSIIDSAKRFDIPIMRTNKLLSTA